MGLVEEWPILHLDMGSCQAETVEGVQDNWKYLLLEEARRNGVEVDRSLTAAFLSFSHLLSEVGHRLLMLVWCRIHKKNLQGRYWNDSFQ